MLAKRVIAGPERDGNYWVAAWCVEGGADEEGQGMDDGEDHFKRKCLNVVMTDLILCVSI
jgi:hypothetical protein